MDVRFAISREETHDNAGLTSMCRNDKSATIRVCPKSLADPDWLGIVDTEITLVHELQHLHASGFDRLVKKEDEEAYRALEVMIDKTAHALVTLSRK